MDNNTIQADSLSSQESQQKADTKSIKIKINIKTTIIIAAIIVAASLIYVYKGLFIAATVDGNPISRLAVIEALEKAAGKNLLDSLIVEKLIQNEAKAKKIVVGDDEVTAEIKKIEDRFVSQGFTLAEELSVRNMSMADLREQILLQKQMEKLVADKINVTDEEVVQYIKDNAISVPKGQEATTTAQIKDELRNQKLGAESNALVTALRAKAKIRYFVEY